MFKFSKVGHKVAADIVLINRRVMSRVMTNPVRLKKNISKSHFFDNENKLYPAICLKYNSNGGHSKHQKVVVAFQESEILQNSDSIPYIKNADTFRQDVTENIYNPDVIDDQNIAKNQKVDRITKYKRIIRASPTIASIVGKYNGFLYQIDPYVKIMRIDKPIGTWLLFWPGGWSIMLAADPSMVSADTIVQNLGLFLTGAFIMRGAGCTINDMWDKDIDAKVERTRSRPLVSGRLSMKNATIFLGAQLSIGLAILLQLNWYSIILGASSLGLVVLYPLAKRVTDYPQLVLGLAFNWGALLGWSASRGSVDPTVCLPLYAAGICWTLLYDTIYAHQDKKDDALIGIKSTALTFNKYTKPWLWANEVGFLTGLSAVGYATELDWPYYAVLGIVGTHVGRQIWTLNPDCPKDCSSKFVSNSKVGLLIFIGIILGKWGPIADYFKKEKTTSAA